VSWKTRGRQNGDVRLSHRHRPKSTRTHSSDISTRNLLHGVKESAIFDPSGTLSGERLSDHRGLARAPLMMRAARSLSLNMKRANSGCVELIGSAPCSTNHSRRSGSASDCAMSFASALAKPGSAPAGAHTPYQIGKSKSGTPASDIVGTSGSRRERRSVLTPSATSSPP
jgi:hypothetical protein